MHLKDLNLGFYLVFKKKELPSVTDLEVIPQTECGCGVAMLTVNNRTTGATFFSS